MALSLSYRRRLTGLLVLSAGLRCLLASVFELGNDEVYYWTYAQQLQWNYFDHPPLVGLWIRLSTWNLEYEWSELAVRGGAILSCAASTVLLFHTVRRLHSERAGWYAALLYNASIYAGIIAGLFILPDSPQMLFWCAALHTLVSINVNGRLWGPWLLFGALAGLTVLSKVHGVFLWFGFGLYILFCRRAWLARPQLYVAALLTAAIASPILLWNLQNDFITYRFHSDRVTMQDGIHLSGFLRELGGQFLYNNPVIVAGTALALLAWRKRRFTAPEPLRLFAFIALPMIGLLLGISLFRDTLPHWSGPAWVTLLPVTAIFLATRNAQRAPRLPFGAIGFTAALVALAAVLTFVVPGTLGKKEPREYGFGDFTLDLHGWGEAGPAFAALYQQEKVAGRMPAGAPVVAHKWFPAAHLEYYFAAPYEIPVLGLGSLHDLHHYAWRNRFALHRIDLTKAWCIVPSNEYYDARTQFRSWYAQADSVTTLTQTRGGEPARYFTVWRLSGLQKGAELPVQGRKGTAEP